MRAKVKKLLFTTVFLIFLCNIQAADSPAGIPIILPSDAIPAEKTAGTELQKELKRIFKREFPIISEKNAVSPAIRLGQSQKNAQLLGNLDFSVLKPDEIILKKVGNDLILTGARPRGTLYAVYEFLERAYGVRYWTPTVAHYPELKEFSLPDIDYRYAPVFRDRKTNHELPRFPEFAVKMRINHDFYMPRRYPPIPESWGGCNSINGWVHTFLQLIPIQKYFATHPEYFAKSGGVRDSHKAAQLCMTNPELRREITRVVLQRLKDAPNTEVISISQSDSIRFCQCPECEKFIAENGNLTDLLIDFVNDTARAVAKAHPHVKVETLAYRSTRQPPQKIRPEPNVIIRVCSIECDFARPLDSKANADFAGELRNWHKIASELYIWNYVTNFTQFYRPHPNLKNLAPDLRFFAENGVTSVMEQGFTRIGKNPSPAGIADLSDLRAYLICKLLWDPYQDPDKITNEFLEGFYGKAAPEVRRYIDIINDAPAKYPEAKVDCYSPSTKEWLNEDDLITAWLAMENAKKLVSGNDVLKKRLDAAALPINMTLLERFELWRKPPAERRPELKQVDWRSLLDEQLKVAEASGINNFAEHSPLSSFEGTRKRISRDIIGPAGGPNEPPEIAGRKWYSLPAAAEARIFEENRYSFKEKDPAASTGQAVRMTPERTAWWIQLNQPPEGRFDIYAEVRCDSPTPRGDAITLGYIDQENRKLHKTINVPASKIAGSKYHLIKIGEADVRSTFCLYAAPVKNQAVQNIWVDRFILAEKSK